MRNMAKVQILGFVVMMVAVPLALVYEVVAFIIFGVGVALFMAGLVLGYIVISLPFPPTKNEKEQANKEGE